MHQKRLIAAKERNGFLDASACIQQFFSFVADTNRNAEVLVGLQEADDLFAKVVDIDDDFSNLLSICK